MKSNARDTYSALVAQAEKHAGDGRFAAARDCFYQALHLYPPTAKLLIALGVCCYECNQLDEALAYTRAGLALSPGDVKSNLYAGVYCLLLGYAEQGWAGFAYRKLLEPPPMDAPPPLPAWQGQALNDRSIVLIREQGYGDMIQCLRYVPWIEAMGGKVYLDVPPPLRSLFSAQAGFGTTLAEKQEAKISTYAYFMDLPMLFGEHPQNPVLAAPYIRLPATASQPELGHIGAGTFKIGLAWAGSTLNGRDRRRSITLDAFHPLLDVPGCQFFSLLNGARAQELALAGKQGSLTCLSEQIHDFLDLALAIDKMDLVITVDTAVAHLAGAMGKPVWTLLSTPADWRWGTRGTTTAWYPSMRLFRQPRSGEWTSVIEDVTNELWKQLTVRS